MRSAKLFRAPVDPAAPSPDLKSYRAIGARLRQVRTVTGLAQNELADRLGVSPASINHWEQGNGAPTVWNAIRLIQIVPVTLDWIYTGDRRGLSLNMASVLPPPSSDGGAG